MRDAFAQELTALAAEDTRIVLLSGDIGNRMFDPFKTRYPDRFLNCGVAEANMTSVAAGLALCGLRPVTYTIASFNTIRCLEQIRVDICYHELPVIIAGVGGGLSYAENAGTHLSCEDIGILRMLPNMTVVCPGDAHEVRAALRAALRHGGPVYLRLGKKGEPAVHQQVPAFELGRGLTLRTGRDLALLSTGNLLPTAMRAADLLQAAGLSAEVVSLHTVKPLDERLLDDVFGRFGLVATLEEHSRIGGLGGAIAEWMSERKGLRARLLRLGTPDAFPHEAGHQKDLRERWGLTAEAVARTISQTLKKEESER